MKKKPFECGYCGAKFLDYASQNPIYCSRDCSCRANAVPAIDRFWSRVIKTSYRWLWGGTRNNNGYGHFIVNGKRMLVHRFSFEVAYSLVPDGLFVLHSCDEPICVNPEHFFLGTIGDNNRDAKEKERNASGESHGMAKLTLAQVNQIRLLWTKGRRSVNQLSETFKVSRSQIGRIIRCERWAMV